MLTLESAYERLSELAQLEDDWDGYGASAIPSCVIAKVGNIIMENHRNLEWLSPGYFGGICIYYEGNFNKLEIEVYVDNEDVIQVDSMLFRTVFECKESITESDMKELQKELSIRDCLARVAE